MKNFILVKRFLVKVVGQHTRNSLPSCPSKNDAEAVQAMEQPVLNDTNVKRGITTRIEANY